MNNKVVKISKFLSYVLRHKPDSIGLQLDENGWADIDDLMRRAAGHGQAFTLEDLLTTVADNDKQRFTLELEQRRIRANQGHTIAVDVELVATEPPAMLYHGTATRFVAAIRREGLKPMRRQHVHLTASETTALSVGSRHGQPTILRVRAGDLHQTGQAFYLSANGVWLTGPVAAEFIE